jgi:hypothetical protein
MTHQQFSTGRRESQATRMLSPLSATRKGTVRSRPRIQYATQMDDIDFARTTLASGIRNISAIVGRDGHNDIRSVANIQKLSMLQEIFPELGNDVLEDVLIAAQFRIDIAASMLGDLSRENEDSQERAADMVFVDWANVQNDNDMNDSDHWHEVSESRPEMQQWVMVQDDWEVVDDDMGSPAKSRSFADVLRSSSGFIEAPVILPQLTPSTLTASLTPLVRQKKADDQIDVNDSEELSIKSFGARKRRFSKKFRPVRC